MNEPRKFKLQTTLGDLIAALSEEIEPFLGNERETSIVIGYIFNHLLKIKRKGSMGHGKGRQRRPSLRVRNHGRQRNTR